MEITFELKFTGAQSDQHVIDMYDSSQAVAGFQRTLALTTHLILNGEVITQAPSLANAQILSFPIQEGSWKAAAIIVPAAAVLLSAPSDSLPGFLIYSGVQHVIKRASGADINYDDGPLLEQLEAHRTLNDKKIDISRLDSVIEKCENSIANIHRPIVNSKTANQADINCILGPSPLPTVARLNESTYEYISKTIKSDLENFYRVKVSSYNINTFMGRAYSPDLGVRTIPFTVQENARMPKNVSRIINSLSENAAAKNDDNGFVFFRCIRRESVSGRLKSVLVAEVLTETEMELLRAQNSQY